MARPTGVRSFSRTQRVTLVVFSLVDLCQGICLSLQAPFFPREAELKGSSATQYGLVFGMFELTKFIVCPIVGKYLHKIGPKVAFNGGIFITSSCAILFGLLHNIQSTSIFVSLCFAVRMLEAVGYAGFLTASFTIIAKEFPENVATIFASLETCFGIGMIVGPTAGMALYQVGGYSLPFATFGTLLFSVALFTCYVLPSHTDDSGLSEHKGSMLSALVVPDIAMAAFSVVCASCSIGFIVTLLEARLRPFQLAPAPLGVMFVITGAVYGTCAPVWGWLCDRHVPPKLVTAVGALLVVVSFSLLGPAPFVPVQPTLGLIVAALVMHGVGFGGEIVAGFVDAHKEAVRHGFPDTIETYGLISGMWASMFALGAFVGPSLAGTLYDHFGFQYACLLVIVLHALLLVMVVVFLCARRRPQEAVPLPQRTLPHHTEKLPLLFGDATDSLDNYGLERS